MTKQDRAEIDQLVLDAEGEVDTRLVTGNYGYVTYLMLKAILKTLLVIANQMDRPL